MPERGGRRDPIQPRAVARVTAEGVAEAVREDERVLRDVLRVIGADAAARSTKPLSVELAEAAGGATVLFALDDKGALLARTPDGAFTRVVVPGPYDDATRDDERELIWLRGATTIDVVDLRLPGAPATTLITAPANAIAKLGTHMTKPPTWSMEAMLTNATASIRITRRPRGRHGGRDHRGFEVVPGVTMRRLTVVVGILGVVAGCGKKAADTAKEGEPAARPTTPVAVTPADATAPTPPPPARLDPGALEAALKAKGIAPDAVKQKIATQTSAWAVAVSKRNDMDDVIEYEVLRVRPNNDIAELRLTPPAAARPPWFSDVRSLGARDVDGDGIDEGMLVVGWLRDVIEPSTDKHCKGCATSTGEQVDQLYVLDGAGATLAPAFTHVVSYKTHSESYPEDNTTEPPDPEEITYAWSVIDGKPATLELTRTKHEVAAKGRLKGVLDPATDPLFAAGAGKKLPLTLP